MNNYKFRILNNEIVGELSEEVRALIHDRPCIQIDTSLSETALNYRPDDDLEDAINTAIAVGEPLLLTGEPGTGKTQAAYFAALQLKTKLFHFQAKTSSSANDLLYEFDTIRYFHEAHISNINADDSLKKLDKKNYLEKRTLWLAFEEAETNGYPCVLLIDEIDKAPRDFPNDLLHELDQMEFKVRETEEVIRCPKRLRPIIFITSNDERRLPPAFLRRCVSHHIDLTPKLLEEAALRHDSLYPELSKEFIRTAIECFVKIRQLAKEKPPATGELLAWLQVLSVTTAKRPEVLNGDIKDLPHLGALIKTGEDMDEIRR